MANFQHWQYKAGIKVEFYQTYSFTEETGTPALVSQIKAYFKIEHKVFVF